MPARAGRAVHAQRKLTLSWFTVTYSTSIVRQPRRSSGTSMYAYTLKLKNRQSLRNGKSSIQWWASMKARAEVLVML
jgi:hypothetical protein